MDLSGAIVDANDVSVPLQLGRYRARVLQQPRSIPAVRSAAFLLPVILLHVLVIWAIANSPPHALARVLAPITVAFLPPQDQGLPPEPPMLPAAALEMEVDPLLQMLPPSVTIDAFEPESRAITTGFTAPKKAIPDPVIDEVVEEEEGTFVRPRPIRGRTGKQRYPSGAAAAGESGRATVKICITARGTVASVEITESTGFERLDNDALDIAGQYQFRPATRNGKAIPVCLPYSINYRIR